MPEITPAEVAAIWQATAHRLPVPPADSCASLAECLTALRGHGAYDTMVSRDPTNDRMAQRVKRMRRDSAALLRYLAEHLDQQPGAEGSPPTMSRQAAESLREAQLALKETLKTLPPLIVALDPQAASVGGSRRPGPVWARAAETCWMLACRAVTASAGRCGTRPDAVAVRLATAFCRRLGFASVTPNAVAQLLKRNPALTKPLKCPRGQ